MYSLDINFLKDRPEYKSNERSPVKQKQAAGSKLPMFAGIAVGVLLPAIVGGFWLILEQQTAQLQAEGQKLDEELARQKAQEDQIAKLNNEIKQVSDETQAFASVFNRIRPWSAILQTISDTVPPNIQIQTIQQSEAAVANANNATPAAPRSKLEISGTARSFNDVNDFLLTLQKSRFFNKEDTLLLNANLIANNTQLEVKNSNSSGGNNQSTGSVTVELPKVIQYRIQTTLSDVPSSELIRDLEGKGAVGLVTRLRTLQQKGVIQR